MSATQDKEFVQSFSIVLGLLVVVTLIVGGVASVMSGGIGKNLDRFKQAQADKLLERITPVVTIEMLTSDAPAQPVVAASASKPPAELFNGVCAACHNTGAAGAPKLEKAAWESRFSAGLDALVSSAIAGKGAMPPKGGSSYSDEEMRAVIQYMLSEAGLMDAPAAEAAAPAAEPAPVAVEAPAADAAPAVVEAAPAPAAPPAANNFASNDSALDLAAGESAYRAACFACHDTGAAGAPKLGDKASWSARIALGMDAMINTAIKGRGAMPPKGGATYLSDAEVVNIVAYMVEKSQ